MTPRQERLAEEARDIAAEIARSLRTSDIPPLIWLGILGHCVSDVLDQIPQEQRTTLATTWCDAILANVRDSLRFDA